MLAQVQTLLKLVRKKKGSNTIKIADTPGTHVIIAGGR